MDSAVLIDVFSPGDKDSISICRLTGCNGCMEICDIGLISNEIMSIGYILSDIVLPMAKAMDSGVDSILKLIDKI